MAVLLDYDPDAMCKQVREREKLYIFQNMERAVRQKSFDTLAIHNAEASNLEADAYAAYVQNA